MIEKTIAERYSPVMKTISYTATALKQLGRIDRVIRGRIVAKIEQYAATPESLGNQVKSLKGSNGLLRLRVGDYRVVFTETGLIIMVVEVGHRREIYD